MINIDTIFTNEVIAAIAAVLIFGCILLIFKPKRKPSGSWGDIEGKLIWVDDGKQTKPFFNRKYKVFGKLDMIYKQKRGLLGVEYKSRQGPIYPSDIAQAKTAALAARGSGEKITKLLIRTKTVDRYIKLPTSDKDLHLEVEKLIQSVRMASAGHPLPPTKIKAKCRNCSHKNNCMYQ